MLLRFPTDTAQELQDTAQELEMLWLASLSMRIDPCFAAWLSGGIIFIGVPAVAGSQNTSGTHLLEGIAPPVPA